MLDASSTNGNRNVENWRPSVRLSVCLSVPYLSDVNRARGAYSTLLTRGPHATRPAYIYVRVLRGRRGRTYFFLVRNFCLVKLILFVEASVICVVNVRRLVDIPDYAVVVAIIKQFL